MNIKLAPRELYEGFLWLCQQIVVVGLLVLITSNVIGMFGFRVPYVPSMDFTALAYLCGAWWLYKRASG